MSRKRYRLKKKYKILVIILSITILLLVNKNQLYKSFLYITSDYNKEAINTFLDTNIYGEIKNYEYSETLEKIINTEYYNKAYLTEYINIKYIDKENYLNNISNLLSLGYNSNDINNIYKKLNNDSIEILLNNEYIKDITNIINLSYFKETNLERYIKYQKINDKDEETVVTYVNIGLDNKYYTKTNDIQNPDNIKVLVNKYNVLKKTYVPNDLENINEKYGSVKLRKEAKSAFESMCKAANKDNIKIYAGSGYRSYNYQENLYNKYVAEDGKTVADTYAARAGYSEHQTGLAVDILNSKWNYVSKNDKEYNWLINNSYKYGYILRYPKDKEEITGYMYEEWHFRYLGEETAKKVYDSKLTYDEYIAKNY